MIKPVGQFFQHPIRTGAASAVFCSVAGVTFVDYILYTNILMYTNYKTMFYKRKNKMIDVKFILFAAIYIKEF